MATEKIILLRIIKRKLKFLVNIMTKWGLENSTFTEYIDAKRDRGRFV